MPVVSWFLDLTLKSFDVLVLCTAKEIRLTRRVTSTQTMAMNGPKSVIIAQVAQRPTIQIVIQNQYQSKILTP